MAVRGKTAPEIRLCGVDDLRSQGEALFALHREEMEPGSPPVDICWTRYYEAEERGSLICLGCWHKDLLIGYCVTLMCGHPHFHEFVICQHDALYLHPDWRKGLLGATLIQQAELAAKESQAQRMLWHAKTDSALAELLVKLGYSAEEIVYQKEL